MRIGKGEKAAVVPLEREFFREGGWRMEHLGVVRSFCLCFFFFFAPNFADSDPCFPIDLD